MSAALKADQLSQLIGHIGTAVGVISLATYRKITVITCAVFLLIISADIFWMLMPTPIANVIGSSIQTSNNVFSAQANNSSSSKIPYVDVKVMQSWHLFGEISAVAEDVNQVIDASVVGASVVGASVVGASVIEASVIEASVADDEAPRTNLSLTLQGLVASNDPKLSQAVIEHGGKADLYKVGQDLPVGRGISVAKILPDRVIIDNRGKNEALFLYDGRGATASKSVGGNIPKVIDHRDDKAISKLAREYKEKLLSNPSSVVNVIRIAPVNDASGNVRGYRVNPGSRPDHFSQLGLKSGDIITAINGISLDDPSNTLKLYQELRNLSEASIDIQRGEQNVSLIIGLDN